MPGLAAGTRALSGLENLASRNGPTTSLASRRQQGGTAQGWLPAQAEEMGTHLALPTLTQVAGFELSFRTGQIGHASGSAE